MVPARPPFEGSRRKLVLAFDVGTTFSGISYSILDPGQVPRIQGVTRFPAQEQVSGSSKIPTVMYYDTTGTVRAVGAEAMNEGLYEQSEDEGWTKVEWFKLHLRPTPSSPNSTDAFASSLPPLPPNKTIVDVLSDFLCYLLSCSERYIKETHPNGSDLWDSLAPEAEYVLSHPNGWAGSQQGQMRLAAIKAGLVKGDADGLDRIHFVTEGEASLHYSLENGLPAESLRDGDGVAIVDAGGGTVDISSYALSPRPAGMKGTTTFEEIAPPQCHCNGSVFVSLAARLFLDGLLKDSDFYDDLDTLVRCFDKTTKLRFRNTKDPQFIKFGSTRDNEPETGIRYGQLKMNGEDVANFFEPSIECIVDGVREQRRVGHRPFTHVVLVGGFASSDWLYEQVAKRVQPEGFVVIRPENHLNKAVADGAMSFYIDHCVRTRVSKFTYGQFSNTRFNPSDPEHLSREKDAYISLSGHKNIKNNFSILLPKNTQVSEMKEFSKDFHISRKSMDKLAKVTVHIWAYKGAIGTPQWKDVDRGNYFRLCTIEVDLSHLTPWAHQFEKDGPEGRYYRFHYKLILLFGLSELKAVFSWKEVGIERRSPAKIIYDPQA